MADSFVAYVYVYQNQHCFKTLNNYITPQAHLHGKTWVGTQRVHKMAGKLLTKCKKNPTVLCLRNHVKGVSCVFVFH